MEYPILEVEPESLIGDEQLGSKPKAWFLGGGEEWLFKEARANTGEDWAEKIAAEVAQIVGINAAIVQLARCRGRNGSASKSFINRTRDNLVHGNELLAGQITGYDRNKRQRQSDHTLENIVATINKLFSLREDIRDSVLTDLANYMVLDALIGNTDRHHENWGLVLRFQNSSDQPVVLSAAPSFDHASSLGRELNDERRAEWIQQKRVGDYVRRARGGIYLRSGDKHGANPMYLVEVAARAHPGYFRPAIDRIKRISVDDLVSVISRVPLDRMSEGSRRFSSEMLIYNYDALIKVAL
jgi:HipA-like C-terminal domain